MEGPKVKRAWNSCLQALLAEYQGSEWRNAWSILEQTGGDKRPATWGITREK